MTCQTIGLAVRKWLVMRDSRGVALIEFALALPFLLVTLIGGLELVHLALTHQQLSRLATSTADLAARYRSSIDETDINTLFLGATLSTRVDDFDERGRVILSSVTRNKTDNGQWIRWQRCIGNASVADSAFGAEGDGEMDTSIPDINGLVVADPNNVLVAEVTYRYRPWFFPATSPIIRSIAPVFDERDIHYSSAFIARELTLNSITNTTGTADIKRC